jgi:hypothetical protein
MDCRKHSTKLAIGLGVLTAIGWFGLTQTATNSRVRGRSHMRYCPRSSVLQTCIPSNRLAVHFSPERYYQLTLNLGESLGIILR